MRFIANKIADTVAHHLRIDARYYLSGGFWLTCAQGLTVLASLLVSVIFANVLEETEYGVYRYILSLGALLTAFSLTGIGQSILQTSAQGHTWFYNPATKQNLLYSAGITLAALIGSSYYYVQENIELALGCILIALLQPLVNVFQQIFPFLQGAKRFKESAFLQGAKIVAVTAICIGVVYLTQSIFILVLAYLASHAATNFVIHMLYKPKEKVGDEKILVRYMAYAKHISLQNVIAGIAHRIDSIIVFQHLGAAELAIYAIASLLPEQIISSFKNIATLLVPKYANYENIGDIRKHVPKRSVQLFAMTVLVVIFYIMLVPYAYHLLFPKYEEAIFLTQLAILALPSMVALIPMSALQSQLKQRELYHFNVQSSVILIVLTVGLTILYGLMGAVIARVVSRYFNLILAYYHLSRSV